MSERDKFVFMLLVGAFCGAALLFGLMFLVFAQVMQLWPPLLIVIPALGILMPVAFSGFWRPGGLNGVSGFLVGLSIGCAGVFATCVGIITSIGQHGR